MSFARHAQRLDLLRGLERELLQQMGATSKSMDMLQGTLRAGLKVATERLASALNSEASKAAEKVPQLEGALEIAQLKLVQAEEEAEEKAVALKLAAATEALSVR